jgi:hypothetical protein
MQTVLIQVRPLLKIFRKIAGMKFVKKHRRVIHSQKNKRKIIEENQKSDVELSIFLVS